MYIVHQQHPSFTVDFVQKLFADFKEVVQNSVEINLRFNKSAYFGKIYYMKI